MAAACIIHGGVAFPSAAAALDEMLIQKKGRGAGFLGLLLSIAARQSIRHETSSARLTSLLSSSLFPSPSPPSCRQKGKKPFKSLRNLKTDLDLNMEGDLNIIMALAEKLRAGLHSFVFGKPFYTSVQEREVLYTL